MAQRIFTDESLATLIDETKAYVDRIIGEPTWIKIISAEDTSYSTTYNTFFPMLITTDHNYEYSNNINYYNNVSNPLSCATTYIMMGDRINQADGVEGVLIGDGVDYVRVTCTVRYKNNDSSGCTIHTYLNTGIPNVGTNGSYELYESNTPITKVAGSSSYVSSSTTYFTHHIDTIIKVQKGSFIFISGYRGTASRDIDVVGDYNITQLVVEVLR